MADTGAFLDEGRLSGVDVLTGKFWQSDAWEERKNGSRAIGRQPVASRLPKHHRRCFFMNTQKQGESSPIPAATASSSLTLEEHFPLSVWLRGKASGVIPG